MAGTGRLLLEFVDVTGTPIADTVDVTLRHQVLHEERRVNGHNAAQALRITDLRTEPQGLYVLEVHPKSYWPVQRFVTIPASGEAREQIKLPIRPDRAEPTFPPYEQLDDRMKGVLKRSNQVKGHEGLTDRALYDALSPKAKAGLLNIAKKSLSMPFKNGGDLLPHITLLDIRGDRCFVEVPSAVKEQVAALGSEVFRKVNGALHDPPPGCVPAGSFKSTDAFGNLQMTFFDGAGTCVADVDIDDAAGLGHVFQVLRNHVTGSPTDPYNIYQILIAHQHLDPGYRLRPMQPQST
jgi:hypothetical protein